MEVRKGYKQTEVGVIPEDWDVFYLSECSKRIKDGEHWTPRRSSNGYYLLSARNVLNGRLDLSDVDFVEEDEYKRIRQRCNPDPGDVLISCSGTIGRVSTVPARLECVLVRSVAFVKPDPHKLAGKYAQYYLQSPEGQKQIFLKVNQGAQPNLFINHIESLPISLPPTLAEQEAIAEALSDADALIESLETLLAKKRQVKQGAMSELLTGKRRLPGFSGEWKRKNIKSIVQTPVTDGPHLTPVFLDTGIPFLSVNNIVDNAIDWSDLRYISLEDHQIFSKKCKPQKNDILLGKAASVGKVAIVETDREFNIWSPIAMIRVSKEYSPKYIYYSLQTRDISKQIEVLTNSSSQGNIGMGEIEKIEVPLPELAEQTAIAEILSDMDAEIRAVEEKLSKARAVKAGMMSELLGGKIRLVESE